MDLDQGEAHLRRRGAVVVLVRRHRFSSGNQVARGTLFHVAQRVAHRICRWRGGCVGSSGGSRGGGGGGGVWPSRDEACRKNGARKHGKKGSARPFAGTHERGVGFLNRRA